MASAHLSIEPKHLNCVKLYQHMHAAIHIYLSTRKHAVFSDITKRPARLYKAEGVTIRI